MTAWTPCALNNDVDLGSNSMQHTGPTPLNKSPKDCFYTYPNYLHAALWYAHGPKGLPYNNCAVYVHTI